MKPSPRLLQEPSADHVEQLQRSGVAPEETTVTSQPELDQGVGDREPGDAETEHRGAQA